MNLPELTQLSLPHLAVAGGGLLIIIGLVNAFWSLLRTAKNFALMAVGGAVLVPLISKMDWQGMMDKVRSIDLSGVIPLAENMPMF